MATVEYLVVGGGGGTSSYGGGGAGGYQASSSFTVTPQAYTITVGAGGTSNTILYYPAKVVSAPKSVGSVDSITSVTYNLELSGEIVEVVAVP